MKSRSFHVRRFFYARRSVTLLEVVLALGLLVVVSSMTYWFYSSSLETGREGTDRAQKIRLARVVLDRISREIRQAATITADNRVGVRGGPERIWLSTYRVPSRKQSEEETFLDEPRPEEYDLSKVEYKIVRHPEILDEEGGWEYPLGLARIEIPIPRPDSAESGKAAREAGVISDTVTESGTDTGDNREEDEEEAAAEALLEELRTLDDEERRGDVTLGPDIQWDELYAPEIRYLRFCYYDGRKWWDTWEVSGEVPLPQLVQVTIGFEPHPPFEEAPRLDEINEKFCTCLNEEPVDCEPLAEDQYSTVVRLPQSDPLFRSRISRETQAFVEQMSGGGEQ